MIVDRQGYIVTNNHVVRNATQVQVTLDNGKTYDAKVVGSDAKTDLAVLKIEATGLRAAPLGDSDQVEVGEWVLAIGSPFEYAQTVTAGIVSAKGRSMRVLADVQGYEDFIQTDAAINPGNSGGPLINLRGEVIGINTAIASRSGGFNGLGFSIPSNMVRSIKDAIMRDGKVRRGQLGTQIGDLSEALAASFGYPSTNGALVSDVVPGSAAEKAGIKHDDIIVAFNGQKIKDVKQLRFAVAATTPGTRTQLQVFRDGKTVSLEVVLEQQSDQRTATNKPRESKRDREENVAADLGMAVEAISPDAAAQLGLRENEKGVVVTEVQVNRLAARAGLQKGDVILSVGEIATPTPQAFQQATKALNQQRGIRIRMLRNGARLYLFLQDR
ncbi:MAG: serine protease [Blastopirellula sp.]|nr:serine protease [Blastopirellula sp.]